MPSPAVSSRSGSGEKGTLWMTSMINRTTTLGTYTFLIEGANVTAIRLINELQRSVEQISI